MSSPKTVMYLVCLLSENFEIGRSYEALTLLSSLKKHPFIAPKIFYISGLYTDNTLLVVHFMMHQIPSPEPIERMLVEHKHKQIPRAQKSVRQTNWY